MTRQSENHFLAETCEDFASAIQAFAQDVLRTLPECGPRFQHARLGLLSEVGEVADLYKKRMQKGKEVCIESLLDEIGDILFYMFELFVYEGRPLTEIKVLNGLQTQLRDVIFFAADPMLTQIVTSPELVYQAMRLNVQKRRKRFPDGFTTNENK